VRQPDAFLPSLALELTMGQWLSVPMIVLGFVLTGFAKTQKETKNAER